MTTGTTDAEYLNAQQVAKLIDDVSTETLKQWRSRAEGPPFIKVTHRSIRYSVADVRAWLGEQTRGKCPSR